MTKTQKIQNMKSGASVLLSTRAEVLSFRSLCYKLGKRPVSRKTVDNRFRVYVYETTNDQEVSV